MSLFRCDTPLNFSRPLRKTMFYGYILPGKEAQQLGRGSKLSTILTQRILRSRIRTFSKNTVSHWNFFLLNKCCLIEERYKNNLVYEWFKVISTAFLLAFISSTTSNHFYRCTLWNQFPSKNLLVEKGVCFGLSILRKSEIVFSPILQLSVLLSLLLWSEPTNLKTEHCERFGANRWMYESCYILI